MQNFTQLRVIGFAVLLGIGAAGCGSNGDLERDETTGQVTAPVEAADIFQIQAGDCFNDIDQSAGVFETLPVVPCSDQHTNEVYLTFDVTGEDIFPGEAAMEVEHQRCIGDEFTSFVGVDYQSSIYEVLPFSPTPESWAAGDREIVCTLNDPTGPMTGSAAGTNR